MQRISNYVRLQGSGTPVANAAVNVYDVGTLVSSVIYSDDGVTLKANPFTADANGFWFFYAASGVYDVRFSGGTIPTPFTWAAISVFDATDAFPGNTSFSGDILPETTATLDVGGNSKLWRYIKAVATWLEDGSASDPSHSFRSDPTSGMWWDAVNSFLCWSFGGAKRLWLDNNNFYVDADVVPNSVQGYALGKSAHRFLTAVINTITVGTLGAEADITCMNGTPEGNLAKPVGSVCLRANGSTGTSFYVKETGGSTVNGWVAK